MRMMKSKQAAYARLGVSSNAGRDHGMVPDTECLGGYVRFSC